MKFWKKCINYSVLVFLHLKTQIKKKVPPEKKFWKLCQKLKLTDAAQNNEMMVVSQMIVTWNQDWIFSFPRQRLTMMPTTCCCCTDVTDIINRVEYQSWRLTRTNFTVHIKFRVSFSFSCLNNTLRSTGCTLGLEGPPGSWSAFLPQSRSETGSQPARGKHLETIISNDRIKLSESEAVWTSRRRLVWH